LAIETREDAPPRARAGLLARALERALRGALPGFDLGDGEAPS
jgi:hypothetical protein